MFFYLLFLYLVLILLAAFVSHCVSFLVVSQLLAVRRALVSLFLVLHILFALKANQ